MDIRHLFLPSPSQGPWEVGSVFATVCLFVFCQFLADFSWRCIFKWSLQSVFWYQCPCCYSSPAWPAFEAVLKLRHKCVRQSWSFLLPLGAWGPACIHPLPHQPSARESSGVFLNAGTWWDLWGPVKKEQNINLMGSNLDSCQFFYVSLIRGEAWGSQ